MFDEEDRIGTAALVVRILRAQNARLAAEEEKAAAEVRRARADALWRKCHAAFSAFGFEVSDKDLWAKVKAAIGQTAWREAISRAQRTPLVEEEEQQATAPKPDEQKEEQADESNEKGTAEENTESGGDDEDANANSQELPKVRQIVLDELKAAGTSGRKALDIRTYISTVLGRELHEKTVGMTLYRLGRDGLVRRAGRTWFFVPPSVETKNPGGDAPGSEEGSTQKGDQNHAAHGR